MDCAGDGAPRGRQQRPVHVRAGQLRAAIQLRREQRPPGHGNVAVWCCHRRIRLTQGETPRHQTTIAIALSHTGGCVRPESAALSPTTLEIGGSEGTATVTVENDTLAPVSDLLVQGWIVQGTTRRAAGNSAPFTCGPGSCVQQFN